MFLDFGGWDMELIKILGVSGQLVAAVILLRRVLSFLCHSDAAVSLLRLELSFLYHSDASEQRTLFSCSGGANFVSRQAVRAISFQEPWPRNTCLERS